MTWTISRKTTSRGDHPAPRCCDIPLCSSLRRLPGRCLALCAGVSSLILKVLSFVLVLVAPSFLLPHDFHLCFIIAPVLDCSHLCFYMTSCINSPWFPLSVFGCCLGYKLSRPGLAAVPVPIISFSNVKFVCFSCHEDFYGVWS